MTSNSQITWGTLETTRDYLMGAGGELIGELWELLKHSNRLRLDLQFNDSSGAQKTSSPELSSNMLTVSINWKN